MLQRLLCAQNTFGHPFLFAEEKKAKGDIRSLEGPFVVVKGLSLLPMREKEKKNFSPEAPRPPKLQKRISQIGRSMERKNLYLDAEGCVKTVT